MATCRSVLTYHEGMLLLRAGRYERALETLQPLVSAGVEDENLELALGMGVLLMRPNDAPPEGSPTRAVVTRAGRAERHHMAKEFAAAKTRLCGAGARRAGVSQRALRVRALPARHRGSRERDRGAPRRRSRPSRSTFAPACRSLPRAIGSIRRPASRSRGEVVTLAPDYPFGHYLLGLLYFDTGDIAHAIPELETAARMLPDEAQFQFALGNAYARAGREKEAARARAAFTRLQEERVARCGRRRVAASRPRPGHASADQKLNRACSSIVRPASPSCASPKCSFRMSAWMFFRLILLNRL